MRAIITLLVLGLTATTVMSNCPAVNTLTALLTGATTYTPTLVVADVVGAATAVASTAASAKCFALNTNQCVKDATAEAKLVADIQSYVTAQKTAMQTASGVRDTYIIEKRGEVITILSSLRRLNELAKANTLSYGATFATFGAAFATYASDVAANFTAIVEGFTTYQEQRAKCMNALLATQAAILCNIYAETATGITHASNTVALSDTFLATLNTECFAYVTNSVKQSSIILAAAYSKGLASLVSGIEKLVGGDATGAATAFGTAWTSFGAVTFSATASQVPAKTPAVVGSACTATTCAEWLEDLFSTTGVLDQTIAVRGGDAVTAFTYTPSRVLSEGKERRLAATGLTPTLASYTFTYGFASNPASVDNTKNSKSALRNGVVAVAIAALALVF